MSQTRRDLIQQLVSRERETAHRQAQGRVPEVQGAVTVQGPGRSSRVQLALYKNDLDAIEQILGKRVGAERELAPAPDDAGAATWVEDAENDIRAIVDEEFAWLEERAREWAGRHGAGAPDFERLFRAQIYQDRARLLAFYLRELRILENERQMAAETRPATGERLTERRHVASGFVRDAKPQPDECDAVTGLYDRRVLNEDLPRALAIATREGVPVACLVMDLDDFKSINEMHGHDRGDEVLRGVAAHLHAVARGRGRAYRWGGGDELVALLVNHTAVEAVAAAERMRSAVAAHRFESIGRAVTISIGVAAYPEGGADAAVLRGHADDALRAAKRAGKNCVVAYAAPGPVVS